MNVEVIEYLEKNGVKDTNNFSLHFEYWQSKKAPNEKVKNINVNFNTNEFVLSYIDVDSFPIFCLNL